MPIRIVTLLLIILVLSVSCVNHKSEKQPDKLNIFVSIAPQKFFLQKICAEKADISVLLPAGASPHVYEPKPTQMVNLSKSRILFTVGGEFESSLLPRLRKSCPGLLIVSTDSTITKISSTDIADTDESTHTHGQQHSHRGDDPHIWLSPELVKEQIRIMTETLCDQDSSNSQLYRENYSGFMNEITELQAKIKENLRNCQPGEPFMVFHPSWGYFAREFNLKQIAIEIEGKEPSMRELALIFEQARANKVKAIFTQPQFSTRSAELIAKELNIRVFSADPIAEDWENVLLKLSEAIGRK